MTTSTPEPERAPAEPGSAAVRAVTVADAQAGERLDRVLTAALVASGDALSRARVQGLITAGHVTGAAAGGGTVTDAGHRVKAGDVFEIAVPPPTPAEPVGEAIPLVVVYEDDALIVIDKPAGLVVHPAAGHADGTLVNALIAHCGTSLSGIGGVRRPGIVHRLDRDTTGLMVVAKSDAAHQGLAAQFAAHGRDGRLERAYLAVVWGRLPQITGTIDAPLRRSQVNRTRMQVAPPTGRARIGKGGTWLTDDEDETDGADSAAAASDGPEESGPRGARHAVTHYRMLETFDGAPAPGRAAAPLASLIEVELETGRTHQIRVHMAHIGHPVLGDPTYGAHFRASERRLSEPQLAALHGLGRQALHAAVLGFEHPITGESLRFESPPPDDLAALVAALRPPLVAPRKTTRSASGRRRPRPPTQS